MDVDVRLIQRLKHHCRNARIADHACAHNGNLGNVLVVIHLFSADLLQMLIDHAERVIQLALADRKGNVLCIVAPDRLQNNINIDIFLCQK